jgi:hypothetical protein
MQVFAFVGRNLLFKQWAKDNTHMVLLRQSYLFSVRLRGVMEKMESLLPE